MTVTEQWKPILDSHINISNIGEHDADNRFIVGDVEKWMSKWQEDHEGCVIIGICYDESIKKYETYYPMVYEDENGNRFYTHIDVEFLKEYIELEENKWVFTKNIRPAKGVN